MRIGFFTEGYLPQPNGVATSVFETARELEKRGHEVIIVAPKYPGYVDRDPHVIRIASLKVAEKPETRIGISLPDKQLRKILAYDFDIIHGHSGGPVTVLGWEIAKARGIPFIVTYHTLWNRYTHYFLKGKVVSPKMMERATKIFGNQVDFLIAPTERVEKELKKYGVKRPIKIVPSGINIEKFRHAKKGFLRSKLKLDDDVPLFLFVGRLGKEKSVDFIIKSFHKVYQENPRVHLSVVGDGPDRKRLEALAQSLGIFRNTHFTGEIESEKMPQVYCDATAFVFSSTTETQGLVLPEALAAGVPVIAIDDPAYEIVKNGENGFIVENKIDDFASKMLLLAKDQTLRNKMSENAKISAEKISVKSTVDLLDSVYTELLEKHNKESVTKIMSELERSEAAFVGDLTFWVTTAATRLYTFIFHKSLFYPKFTIAGQTIYHSTLGVFFLLVFLALFFKKRKIGLFALIFLGAGAGLLADDGVSMLMRHVAVFDYWNPLNLALILTLGIIPLFLMRKKTDERPKFYVTSQPSPHINPKNPKVSVVVPAFNEAKFIGTTLQSLLKQTYKNFELLVVDNNSQDDTGKVAQSFGARVVVQKIKGVAAARQKGFEEAGGEIILSIDADSVAPENWVENVVKRYEKNHALVGVGGLSLLYSGPVTARSAARYLYPYFCWLDELLSGGANMAGFNMSVRKSAFKKSGGFNTALKMGEDVDLSEKLRYVGKVELNPKIIVYVSGRRYAHGLLKGMMVYAPWWFSKVILRQERPFEFPSVRSEKGDPKSLEFLPISFAILFLTVLFYLGNIEY